MESPADSDSGLKESKAPDVRLSRSSDVSDPCNMQIAPNIKRKMNFWNQYAPILSAESPQLQNHRDAKTSSKAYVILHMKFPSSLTEPSLIQLKIQNQTHIMAETAEIDTAPVEVQVDQATQEAKQEGGEEQQLTPNDDNAVVQQQSETAVTTTTDADGTQKKTKKIIRKKRRPARPQVDPATVKSEPPPQTGTVFNIWYNKWSGGDREDKYLSKHAAPSRCNIAKDSGYTRADKVTGSYFCLFFARGVRSILFISPAQKDRVH